MRIGWAIMTVGCFGSVREMVEMSNALIRRGHDVTIYHPTGGPVVWLPSLAKTGTLEKAIGAELDVLIAFPEFTVQRLFDILQASRATVKAFVVAGFTPTDELATMLRGETDPQSHDMRRLRDAMRAYWTLPDSDWQRDWLRERVLLETGPGWAGINLEQFHAIKVRHDADHPRVIWSGDPRERKGGDTVRTALDLVTASRPKVIVDSYWGKRIPQDKLAEWISSGDVFVDGHRRAGWCNPVAEAMACGVPVVCTDIPATRLLAEQERTALVVEVDDALDMALAILRLLKDAALRQALIHRAYRKVITYSYDLVAVTLEEALENKLESMA